MSKKKKPNGRIALSVKQAEYLRTLETAQEIAELQYRTAVLAIAKGLAAEDGEVRVDLGTDPHISLVEPKDKLPETGAES